MGAQTVIEEEINSNYAEWPRIQHELKQIAKRICVTNTLDAMVKKLTFLQPALPPSALTEVPDSIQDTEILGYAILISFKAYGSSISYIFEAVTRPLATPILQQDGRLAGWRLPPDTFLHVQSNFTGYINVQDRVYQIPGTYFCQQNGITTVCGHACAAMMLNNTLRKSEIISCESLNELIGVDHEKRMLRLREPSSRNHLATHSGITIAELEKILRHFSLRPRTQSFDAARTRPMFREFLYGFIESGYPALLDFETRDNEGPPTQHVVAILGHTLNPHSWFPSAFIEYNRHPFKKGMGKPFLSSLAWVDNFIVNDDNFGIQFHLPAHSFQPEEFTTLDVRPTRGIGVLPESLGSCLSAAQAEMAAYVRLTELVATWNGAGRSPKETYYLEHLRAHLTSDRCRAVFRTSLVSSREYMKHLDLPDNTGAHIDDYTKSLIEVEVIQHEYLWLVEVTEPNLYVGNLSKVIDILIDPKYNVEAADTRDDSQWSTVEGRKAPATSLTAGVVLFRFPGFFSRPFNKDTYEEVLFDVDGHFPLFSRVGAPELLRTSPHN